LKKILELKTEVIDHWLSKRMGKLSSAFEKVPTKKFAANSNKYNVSQYV
jgi:hypothetical protein